MRIDLKCKCGATAVFEDGEARYINSGGDLDALGRKYRIEAWADNWLGLHKVCLQLPAEPTETEG